MQASLFDSNIWLALTFQRHVFHEIARSAFRECTPESPAMFCRATEQSFLRLASTPSVLATYQSPNLTNHDAIRFLENFHKNPAIAFSQEPPSTRDLWLRLADRQTASPKLWMDAYLAAFAISGNLRFVTTDKDFRQFESDGLQLHLLTK